LSSEKKFVEYINGSLISYQHVTRGVEFESIESTSSFASQSCTVPSKEWISVSADRRTVATTELTETEAFSDGTLVYHSKTLGANNLLGVEINFNFLTQGSFTGFCGLVCPTVGGVPFGAPVVFNLDTLVRAFTGKVADAMYHHRDILDAFQDHGVVRLRGQNVSGLVDFSSQTMMVKDYVADVSPQGALFFATSDKSVIIHDNQSSGMPKVVIPATVVKLIAALWL